jgi:hypothetical protein
MADRKKFEEMLERLINEDKAGAEELFHEIVVEKSREIYENLLEDDLEDKDVDEASDEEVDESDDEEVDEASDEEVDESDDEDTKVDEDFNLDEFEVEADPMAAMGGDPADNMMGDVEVDGGDMGMDDMGGDEEGGNMEDRVVDLEDALDELKAEFEKMMSGEEGEEGSDDMDMDDMGGDEEGSDDEEGEESDDEEKESYAFEAKKDKKDDKKDDKKKDMKKSAAEEMREYVEKVGGQTYNQFGKMGDNGANTKSIVANKNDMGGTASNLNQAGTEQGVEANKGQLKGNGVFKGSSPKEDNAGNVNVPGSKSATKMSGVAIVHGAEKKGSGDTAANKKSIIGGK